MTEIAIPDPAFAAAVAAIDAGDTDRLGDLLAAHPRLAADRLEAGAGYFARPYLLWFVAENPVRRDTLPANIVDVARFILHAARERKAPMLQEQVDGALGLVCSGRVVRERGVQEDLIDLLLDAGAKKDDALVAALAHRETAAAEWLLTRGATPTLLAAACAGSHADVARLAQDADPDERQLALAGAALYGRTAALAHLVALGADVRAYSPRGFHPHGTALHHAVDSGSLDVVRILVEAGADLDAKDRVHQGTPLDWAVHGRHAAIEAYLRGILTRRQEGT